MYNKVPLIVPFVQVGRDVMALNRFCQFWLNVEVLAAMGTSPVSVLTGCQSGMT